ncbi:MAG: hemin transporter [Microlunatus sp.]|nr:hemin transporter [Microlunatus sp.]
MKEFVLLSPASAEVVRATLPVIGAAIGDITPVFYQRLFDEHPDLGRDLFNRANQAQGHQQRALAGAIAAYASLLVAEDGPDPKSVLARIAHKHASLGVIAEQYKAVHDNLFAAIIEVLGDAVTPEVAAAWDEVYWEMANALIEVETGLYTDAGAEPGEIWRTLIVDRRVQQSPTTVSFRFVSPDGSPLPPATPGQYLSVAVQLPDGAQQIRQYSLTNTLDKNAWEITVKAIGALRREGRLVPGGVSNFLHDNVFEGDEVKVSAPFGELTLPDGEAPLVLISAGIGITPMMGFLHYLADTGSQRQVLMLHADQSPSQHAHRNELLELVAQLPGATLLRWYEDPGVRNDEGLRPGRIDLSDVELPDESEIYLCGPLPFMAVVHDVLLERGVPEERIHYEIFGPARKLPAA